MKLAAPCLRPMSAFLSTVGLVLAYFVAALLLVHTGGSRVAGFSGAIHVALVWLPLAASGVFYAWVSHGVAVSRPRRLVQVAAATVLAPIIAACIVALAWFGLLGGSM
jgi:hypothetical protein